MRRLRSSPRASSSSWRRSATTRTANIIYGKTALEIGCGKGEFLVALCERTGCAGIGIDPGYRPERTHSSAASRLTFIQDFYGPQYSDLKADYVCCRHTLEHIDDVLGFMQLVREAIGTGRTCRFLRVA